MEPRVVLGDSDIEVLDVNAGEVVGLDDVIHLRPRGVRDQFVGCAETLQNDNGHVVVVGIAGVVDRKLDVAEHPVGVAMRDEQWAVLARSGSGKFVAVDEPHSRLDRIDAQRVVGQIEKRHRRQQHALHAGVGAKVTNAALKN